MSEARAASDPIRIQLPEYGSIAVDVWGGSAWSERLTCLLRLPAGTAG